MKDYFNKKEISQRAEDELLYEYVMEEMEEQPNLIKGLWAKAIAHSEGNNEKARSLYMQYRVQSIKDDFKLLEISYDKLTKEKLWDIIKNSFVSDDENQKIKQERKEKQEKEKYGKISGWLIFFAVLLILWNISQVGFYRYFERDYVAAIQNMYLFGNENMAQTLSYIFHLELFASFMLFLFTSSFFSKNKMARILGIVFFALVFIITPLKVVLLLNLYNEMSELPPIEIVKMIGSLFWALLFLLYFIFSKRVKKTFVYAVNMPFMFVVSLFVPMLLFSSYHFTNGKPTSYESQSATLEIANKHFENKDYTNANIYYDISVENGYNPHNIAEIYFEEDMYEQSIQWYKKAVDRGDNSAKFQLAYSYSVIKDYNNAIKYYSEYLTYKENVIAMNNLANVYLEGKKDYWSAIEWYEKAIEKGYEGCYFQIAYSYHMLEDYVNAVIWYEKSIKQDKQDNKSDSSLWNLHLIYLHGGGKVARNETRAFELCLKAARLGDENAITSVAALYALGIGTQRDDSKANYWDNKAKELAN